MKRLVSMLMAAVLLTSAMAGCNSTPPAADEPAAPASSAPASQETPAPAESEAPKELRKVTYVFPRTLETLEDTPFWVAKNLGYWEEEGLDVSMEQSFGTTDIKMVATGNADFACPGSAFILTSIEEELPIKVISGYDTINIWGMCVLKDSKIQTWDDMKGAQEKYGKKLTVALGDAAWEMLLTPTLQAAGVDPVNDVEFVVAGENRYIQVAEGKLDMLFSWPGEAWQLMGQGFDFNYIDGNDILKTCSNSFVTNTKLIETEPEVVRAFVKGIAKGMYFTKYNPEAAAAVSCSQFPSIDVTWKAATFVQQGRAYQMFGPEGGEEEQKLLDNIGKLWDDKWQLTVDTSVSAGVIKNPIPLDQIFTNDFILTDIDKKAIEADADAYDVASVKAKYKAE